MKYAPILILFTVCAVFAMPAYLDQGTLFLAGITVIQAVFALSWALLFARTGLLVFGHAGFFTLGAYTLGYLVKFEPGVPFIGSLVLGAIIAGVVALALGSLVVERASGVAFAILTLALSEILRTLISYSEVFGRDDGLSGIPRPFGLSGTLGTNVYFWFVCAVCGLTIYLLYWLTNSRFGRVLYCIRQDPTRTAFMGYSVRHYRIVTFGISAAVAGLAGGLYAPWAQIITPEICDMFQSTQPMLNTMLGGAAYFLGPVVGAVIFTVIGYATRTMLGISELVTGGILLLIILAAPSGVLGLLGKILRSKNALPGRKTSVRTMEEGTAE